MKRRTPREQLAIVKAQLRAVTKLVQSLPTARPSTLVSAPWPEQTGRYIQIASIRRGFADILHALDDTGQVWELKTSLGEKIAGQPREVKDAWWEKVTTVRR